MKEYGIAWANRFRALFQSFKYVKYEERLNPASAFLKFNDPGEPENDK